MKMLRFFRYHPDVNNPRTKHQKSRGYMVFIVFLLLSIFLWILKKMNNEFTTTISYSAIYNELPAGFNITTNNHDTLNIELTANGTFLLKQKLFNESPTVTIDTRMFVKTQKRKNGQRYFLSKNFKESLSSQLGNSVSIISIEPDTVYFSIHKNRR